MGTCWISKDHLKRRRMRVRSPARPTRSAPRLKCMLLDRIPIRFRLSLVHAGLMAVLLLGVGIGLYQLVERNLFQSVDAALLTSARAIRDARFVKGFSSPLLQSFLDNFLGEKFIRPYAQL